MPAYWFFSLPPEVMTALATLIGFALLDDMTADQQNSLGNFLMLIGQVLETSANQKQLLSDIEQNRLISQMQCEINELKRKMDEFAQK